MQDGLGRGPLSEARDGGHVGGTSLLSPLNMYNDYLYHNQLLINTDDRKDSRVGDIRSNERSKERERQRDGDSSRQSSTDRNEPHNSR